MRIETVSLPLDKALVVANSTAPTWNAAIVPQVADPGVTFTDGMVTGGQGGDYVFNRLCLMPYCRGLPNSQFSVRLYAWNVIRLTTGDATKQVWIPALIAEFACIACNVTGPTSPYEPSGYQLSAAEYLCDTITLVQGNLGWMGNNYSTGPGTNLVAMVMVDVAGAQLLQFDFQQNDTVDMNCLWCPA